MDSLQFEKINSAEVMERECLHLKAILEAEFGVENIRHIHVMFYVSSWRHTDDGQFTGSFDLEASIKNGDESTTYKASAADMATAVRKLTEHIRIDHEIDPDGSRKTFRSQKLLTAK